MNWKLNRGDIVLAIMIVILIVPCCYEMARGGELEDIAEIAARTHGLPVPLVFSLIQHESSWRPDVAGDDGRSIGLMQINAVAHGLSRASLYDPVYNVEYGCAFLRLLCTRFSPDTVRALTAWNFGARRTVENNLYVGEFALRVWTQYKRESN